MIFLRIGLGVGDDLFHRFVLRVGVDHQHVLVKGEIGDGGEVLESDRGQAHQRRRQKARHRGDEVVGVLLLAGHIGEGDAAASARLVLDDQRLGKQFLLFNGSCHGAGEDVAASAGAGMDDDGDGFFGVFTGAQGGSRSRWRQTDNNQ